MPLQPIPGRPFGAVCPGVYHQIVSSPLSYLITPTAPVRLVPVLFTARPGDSVILLSGTEGHCNSPLTWLTPSCSPGQEAVHREGPSIWGRPFRWDRSYLLHVSGAVTRRFQVPSNPERRRPCFWVRVCARCLRCVVLLLVSLAWASIALGFAEGSPAGQRHAFRGCHRN